MFDEVVFDLSPITAPLWMLVIYVIIAAVVVIILKQFLPRIVIRIISPIILGGILIYWVYSSFLM